MMGSTRRWHSSTTRCSFADTSICIASAKQDADSLKRHPEHQQQQQGLLRVFASSWQMMVLITGMRVQAWSRQNRKRTWSVRRPDSRRRKLYGSVVGISEIQTGAASIPPHSARDDDPELGQ